ncbi:MAG: AraC family transcriptional regulator ligand-binding domain-containing protein [Halioglobus sp.]
MARLPEVSRAYIRIALQNGDVPPDKLLVGTGLTEEKLALAEFVPATELATIFHNYNRHAKNRAWPAELGAKFNLAAHGPMGFAALSAPTLGDALDVIATLYPSRITAISSKTYDTATHTIMEMHNTTADDQFGEWMVEVIMKIAETVLEAVLGHPVGQNVTISLAHKAPKNPGRLIKAFDAKVIFNADSNAIALPVAWRQLPSPLHDESAYRTNLIKCRELIAEREQSDSTAFAVCNSLYQHFDAQLLRQDASTAPPTLERMAEQLFTTPRTLIRRLENENTSFKQLLESLRREYAEKLLKDARLNIADVAEILGYSDQANFGRAFRRWYGESPAHWRKR